MAKRFQQYAGKEITVTFDPNLCRHTGVCLRSLGQVFDVRRKRWIEPDKASGDEVEAAVRKCPSGALQFIRSETEQR